MSDLTEYLTVALGRSVRSVGPIPGGDICDAWRAETDDGPVFVKTHRSPPPDLFEVEAAGLRWLAEAHRHGGPPVPAVVAVGDELLALEWVEPGRSRHDEAGFGQALAALHHLGAEQFGGSTLTGYLGSVPVDNRPAETWAEFWVERRLLPLVRTARNQGTLSPETVALADRLADHAAERFGSPEPPARLHGDLWSGNVHWDRDGIAWLIDPAAYGGHREVDLAMLQLFGLPSSEFFAAYHEAFPLADGWRERVQLHQLTPLLVHAILFGGGYGAQATAVIRAAV